MKSPPRCLAGISFVLAFFIGGFPVFSLPEIVIDVSGYFHPMSQVCGIILPEAYRRLGYHLVFRDVPPNRADVEVNQGRSDGFVFSDDLYLASHPGSVKVDYPLGSDDIMVFTKGPAFQVGGWKSLTPYLVGYLKGMWVVESNLGGLRSDPANTPPQVFQMLEAGRSAVAVMPYSLGLASLRSLGITDIRVLRPPLKKVLLYHFLAAKNASLAPKLAKILEEMDKQGLLRRAIEEVYVKYRQEDAPSPSASSK